MVDMKKFIVITFSILSLAASADAQYVRKLKEPDFFIPAGEEMHKAEKLPEIRVIQKENTKAQQTNEVAQNLSKNTVSETTEKVMEKNTSRNYLKQIPEYKNKYNQYINDIMRFYSDGVMPKNEILQNDLAAMNSDEHRMVKAPAPNELTSKEMADFYALYQKMLKN